MEVPPKEYIELLVKQAAQEAAERAVEVAAGNMPHAMTAAIDAYFKRLGLEPDHFVWVRRRYDEERDTWSTARRIVMGLVLVAVLTFMGVAARDAVMAKVVKASAERNGGVHGSLGRGP